MPGQETERTEPPGAEQALPLRDATKGERSALAFSFPSAALVKRELIRDLRRPRSFVCLAAFVAVCILVAVSNLPTRTTSMAAAGSVSRELVQTIIFTLSIGCVLFIPGLAGTAIAAEKEQSTFDLLHLTLIRPHGIVIAKLLNTLGLFLLLTVVTMPVLGAVLFLVGIDWAELARLLMVLAAATLSCAMVGMLCSARFARTSVAIVASYAGMIIVMGAPVLLVYMCAAIGRFTGIGYIHIDERLAVAFSPLVAVLDSNVVPRASLLLCIVYQTALAITCFLLTLRILRRAPKPAKVETRKPIDDAAVLEARRKSFPFYLIDPLRRKKPIEDERNPMFVKELRWGAMGRSTVLIRVFYSSLIAFLLAAAVIILTTIYGARTNIEYRESIVFLLAIQMGVTVIIGPALLANALTKEYELGNMDILRTTLLVPEEIVWGKVLAGAVCLSPLLLAAFLSSLPLAFVALFHRGALATLFTGYVTLLVCAFVSLSLGLLASILTRHTGTSIVLSYLMSVMIFGGFAFLFFLLGYGLLPRPFAPNPSNRFLISIPGFLSPITAFVANNNFVYRIRGHRSPLNLYWFANVALFAMLGRAIIRFCVAQFIRYGMRDR